MAKHYTAVLEIIETDEYMAKDQFGKRVGASETRHRQKNEVARVVVRGDSMATLLQRLKRHVQVIADEEGSERVELKDEWGGRA